MMIFKRMLYVLLTVCIFTPFTAHAAGGAKLMHMDVDLSDMAALQRGASTFANYCMGCHSAEYMRYSRMGEDLGISEDILKTNFMFGDQKAGETMTIAMDKLDAERFWGVLPPDLSVIARSRGPDYLYTYLKTFYRDETRPFGVNNLVLKNASMPHVLWDLQGMQALDLPTEEEGVHHTPTYEDLKLVTPGTQSVEEYDQTIQDLVNYLVYMGEPIKLERSKIGIWVMLYLVIFAVVAYLLKKEYWRDIH